MKGLASLRVDPHVTSDPEARVVDGARITLTLGGLNWVHVAYGSFSYGTQDHDSIEKGLQVAQQFASEVQGFLKTYISDGRVLDKQQRIAELKRELAMLEAE